MNNGWKKIFVYTPKAYFYNVTLAVENVTYLNTTKKFDDEESLDKKAQMLESIPEVSSFSKE